MSASETVAHNTELEIARVRADIFAGAADGAMTALTMWRARIASGRKNELETKGLRLPGASTVELDQAACKATLEVTQLAKTEVDTVRRLDRELDEILERHEAAREEAKRTQ